MTYKYPGKSSRDGGEAVANSVAAMEQIVEKIGLIIDLADKTNHRPLPAAIDVAHAAKHCMR